MLYGVLVFATPDSKQDRHINLPLGSIHRASCIKFIGQERWANAGSTAGEPAVQPGEVLWCPCCGERGSKGVHTFYHLCTRGASLGSTGDALQHCSKQVVGPKYIAGCQKIPKD